MIYDIDTQSQHVKFLGLFLAPPRNLQNNLQFLKFPFGPTKGVHSTPQALTPVEAANTDNRQLGGSRISRYSDSKARRQHMPSANMGLGKWGATLWSAFFFFVSYHSTFKVKPVKSLF